MAKNIKKNKSLIFKILGLIFLTLLLSFRLTKTPPGLTIDEAAFGYNGVLLSESYHDENGEFLPFFVNSISGKDWRQPVTQYFIAFVFKFIKPSVFTLRLSSVLVALFSVYLIFLLARKLLGEKYAYISSILLVTTPIIFIQSHMALDNIMPVPFALMWLLCIFQFEKKKSMKYLFLAGVSLGISFYTYKAMRIIVPVWGMVTVVYLYSKVAGSVKEKISNLFEQFVAFFSGAFPFILLIPFLSANYPGAMAGGYRFKSMPLHDFLLPYLSTFDPSFLFIKGDLTPYHSTGIHGMFLLATLPLFLIGLYRAIKKRGYWTFVLLSFFSAPLLFGLVNSVYRASRLLVMVPSYVLISALGIKYLSKRKVWLFITLLLVAINFIGFSKYYWYKYPKAVVGSFSQTKDLNYSIFAKEAKKRGLKPFVDEDMYNSDGDVAFFYEAAFFDESISKWKVDMELPEDSILMTYRENVEGLVPLNLKLPNFFLHITNEK